MTIRDLENNLGAVVSLAPAARNANATGTTVDLQGHDSAMVAVIFGAYTDGSHTPSIEHSHDGSSYEVVPAAQLNGTLTAVTGAGGANSVQKVGYIGGRRYIRALLGVSGATTGALCTALVLRGDSHRRPL